MNNLIKKIALGTAQLDNSYGKDFRNNKLKINEFQKILQFSEKNKIFFIDTAEVYKKAHDLIGRSNNNRFKIITKISDINHEKIEKKIYKFKKNLKVKIIEGILFHNEKDLLSKNGLSAIIKLKKLKKKKIIKKIGVSIYDPKNLLKIIHMYDLDFIQVPYNIFDNRFFSIKILKLIKKKKIEIHARSIFLKGLLTSKKIKNKKKYLNFSKDLNNFEKLCIKKKISKLQFCINYAFSNKNIDKIVLGIDGLSRYKEILNAVKKFKKINKINFNIKNKSIVDPRKWI